MTTLSCCSSEYRNIFEKKLEKKLLEKIMTERIHKFPRLTDMQNWDVFKIQAFTKKVLETPKITTQILDFLFTKAEEHNLRELFARYEFSVVSYELFASREII
jgi:hypothetical protein